MSSTFSATELAATGYDLNGRVAIVTGAARGIGRACALRLAVAGADVVIVDRDLTAAREFNEQLTAPDVMSEVEGFGRRSAGFEVDLVDRRRVDGFVADVMNDFGRIDVIVNMAGGMITPMEGSLPSTMPAEDTAKIFDVNFSTVVNVSQAVVPAMREQGSGSIVNVTGGSAIAAYPGGRLAHYGAAKIAVLHYTRSLASELGPEGIRANAVSPGVTHSSRIAAQAQARNMGTDDELDLIPLRRFGTPDDIAKAVTFLAGDMSSYITGQCLSVCGGSIMTPN